MSKGWTDKETPAETIIKLLLLGVIVAVATYKIFFDYQACNGLDAVNFYCKVHPMKFFDIVGCIIFYFGVVIISGITPIRFWNAIGSVAWNLIWAAAMLISLLMMYFL